MMEELSNLISQYGFPIIAAIGAGYMVYYVWRWTTEVVDPILSEAKTTLIALIDRVRMLDNDLIRLNQKLNVILQLREQELEEQRKKDLKKDKD
jgi:hypothetical protein